MTRDFPLTRWSLVARIGGSPSELATLVEIYAPAIARYLAIKFPEQRAAGRLEDVSQETLIALLEHPGLLSRAKPGEGSRFRYLVMTTAYLLARNALRRISRASEHEVAASQLIQEADIREAMHAPFAPDDAVSEMDRSWAAGVIASAWEDLRAWCAEGTMDAQVGELLHEHLALGMSIRAIADRHGLPLTTCHRQLAKGRMHLQRGIVDRLRIAHEGENLDPAQAYDVLASILRRGDNNHR